MRSKLLARHKHGVSKREFKADESDGCAIYWVMLQLFHPLSRDYRRTLELKLNKYSARFSSGNPSTPLTDLQADTQEALDLMLRVRWDTCAIPIIDTLGARDALFQVELAKFRELPEDPDNSAVELDQLCSHIATVIETLDTAKKSWEDKTAFSAKSQTDFKKMQSELKELKALMSSGNSLPSDSRSGGQPKQGMCQAKGCSQRVKGWTRENRWKLCSTCLLECRKSGKPVTLNDGSLWGKTGKAFQAQNRSMAGSVLGEMRKAGIKGVPASNNEKAAKKAQARAAKRSKSDVDPESPGGQDGDATQSEDEGSFSKGSKSMFKSLRAKRLKKGGEQTHQ